MKIIIPESKTTHIEIFTIWTKLFEWFIAVWFLHILRGSAVIQWQLPRSMPNSKTVLKQTVPKGREGQNIGYFTALMYMKLSETWNFACKPGTMSKWRKLILFTGSAHTLVGNTSQYEVKANNSCNSIVNRQFWTHSPAE